MQARPLAKKRKPEEIIRDDLRDFLQLRNWIVRIVHGGAYQSGFPDLYCTHKKYGIRWIEVKLPEMEGSRWTKAQLKWFPIFSANGTPIWILTGATEREYKKLWEPENWFDYMLLH